MHRIDATGYAAGNLFTDGNPSTGTPATVVDAAWLNDLQENVAQVIEAAGIGLSKGDYSQLKSAIQQLIINGAVKTPVRVATTTNIAALAGGAPSALDGVALAVSDRILVKDQTTGSQNGIYIVTTVGTGSNGTWARSTDADGVGELAPGQLIVVNEGSTQADSIWELSTDGAVTIGTTSLTFTRKDSSQGNFAGLNAYNASATLPASDLGKLVAFYGSTAGQTLTLPAVAGVVVGKNYNLVNQAGTPVTIKGNAAENISRNVTGVGQTLSNTVVLNPGDSLVLSSNGGSQWNAEGQSAPDMFPNSLSASGYQKLPNGLIIQWGTATAAGSSGTITFPVAFTTACYSIAGQQNNAGATQYAAFGSPSATSVTFYGGGSNIVIFWIAIGK